MVGWITEGLKLAAAARKGEARTVLRRLTKEQYTNTLQDLLGLDIDFGRVLPDDAKSEMGFSNNGEVLQASSLHFEYYQEIARHALEQAVAVGGPPPVTRYRVTFGKGLGKGQVAGHTGGYQSVPLSTDDFLLEVLDPDGRPIEPADGPAREEWEALRRRISIGLRGSSQSRFRVMEDGMILYGARPHVEHVPAAWQGPSPNLKLEMQRCFPERGEFELRVVASRGYLVPSNKLTLIELEERVPVAELDDTTSLPRPAEGAFVLAAGDGDERKNVQEAQGLLSSTVLTEPSSVRLRLELPEPGYFQFDMVHPPAGIDAMPSVRLTLDGQHLDHRLPGEELDPETDPGARRVTALGAAYLPAGRRTVKLGGPFFVGFSHLVVTPLPLDHPSVVPLTDATEELAERVGTKTPSLRAYVGTRTDDGMDYKTFGERRSVTAPLGSPETYTFRGRLENLPIPEPDSGDTEILSGFMLLGLWNDHLVKNSGDPGPPVLVRSMEFEAPFQPTWPPASHRAIFDGSEDLLDPRARTRALLTSFLGRAFRRPARRDEVQRYLDVWQGIRGEFDTYEESVREILVAVLCSPHFLFLVEPELGASDEIRALPSTALASRLSYFLWNSPPDGELLRLAAEGQLEERLGAQVDRMLDDPRTERFVRPFVREWLRLDRHEGMSINVSAHPKYTRFVKEDLHEETQRFFHEVLRGGHSLFALLDPEFAMLNQNLAEYYGIEGVEGMEFRPVPLPAGSVRGGLLTQGAFLAGHSDGTQAHPIKRAVWVREKLLGDPPPPPPPNVPDLDPEAPGFEGLTLKEQLERHRDNPSCHDCHAGIDPYGIVFESYDAGGMFNAKRGEEPIDVSSTLPDGTEVVGVEELKNYLLNQKGDEFAGSLIKHLFAYALGRDVHFSDAEELAFIRSEARARGDRLRGVVHAIVQSPSFRNP